MRERPVAVLIFGILNIGFGLLGLLGLLAQSSFASFGTQASIPMLASIMAFIDEMNKNPNYILWQHISTPVEGLASIALLAAGIGLLLLKNWARITSVAYGIYKIVFNFVNIAVLYLVLGGMIGKALKNLPSIVMPIAACGALFLILIALAYPVLLIFFLTRPKNVAAFRAPPPGVPPL
jgi:hypothetical protein